MAPVAPVPESEMKPRKRCRRHYLTTAVTKLQRAFIRNLLPRLHFLLSPRRLQDQVSKSLVEVTSAADLAPHAAKEKKDFMQSKTRSNPISMNLSKSSLLFNDEFSASHFPLKENKAPLDVFNIQSAAPVEVVHKSSTFESKVFSTQSVKEEKRQKKPVEKVPVSSEVSTKIAKKVVPQKVIEAGSLIQSTNSSTTGNTVIRNAKKSVLSAPVTGKLRIERAAKKMVSTSPRKDDLPLGSPRPSKKMTSSTGELVKFSGDHVFMHPIPPTPRSAKKLVASSASGTTLTGPVPKSMPPPPPSYIDGAGSRRVDKAPQYSMRGWGPVGAGVTTLVLC